MHYLNFTAPYLRLPMSVFMAANASKIEQLNDLESHRVAVIEGHAQQEFLERLFPNMRVLPVKNAAMGLRWVSLNKADAYVGNAATGHYVIHEQSLTHVKLALHTRFEYDLAIGVRKDWPELAAILNKGLQSITQEEHRAIADRWRSPPGDGVPAKRWLPIVIWVMAGCGLAVAILTIWVQPIRRRKDADTTVNAIPEVIQPHSIQEAEDKFRAAFNASQDGMIFFDEEGIIDCNHAALRMLGYRSKEQVTGLKLDDISPNVQPDGSISEAKGREMVSSRAFRKSLIS